jgi:hypothetical protein
MNVWNGVLYGVRYHSYRLYLIGCHLRIAISTFAHLGLALGSSTTFLSRTSKKCSVDLVVLPIQPEDTRSPHSRAPHFGITRATNRRVTYKSRPTLMLPRAQICRLYYPCSALRSWHTTSHAQQMCWQASSLSWHTARIYPDVGLYICCTLVLLPNHKFYSRYDDLKEHLLSRRFQESMLLHKISSQLMITLP